MNTLIIEDYNNYISTNECNSRNNIHKTSNSCNISSLISFLLKQNEDIVFFINGSNNNNSSSKDIIEFIKKENIQKVIIYVDYDNIITSLKLINIINDNVDVESVSFSVFSINKDFRDKIPENIICFNFDEKKDFSSNLFEWKKISEFTHINHNLFYFDFLLQKNTINIGTGCSRNCLFCNISNSIVNYRPVDDIIDEIENMLISGEKYFHILNHNFTMNLEFANFFCNKLIDRCKDYDFIWSCYAIPEKIIQDLEIISLFKTSKLGRIELGIENINDDLLSDFGIRQNTDHVIEIVKECLKFKITSISANFIVGTPNEREQTLFNTKNFIGKLLQITNGSIDININCFYPESEYFSTNKISNLNFTPIKCIRRKNDFVIDSFYLDKKSLFIWKYDLMKYIYNIRDKIFCFISPEIRVKLMKLSNIGLVTQISKYHLLSCVPNSKYIFNSKDDNIFYSWEIDSIDDYVPIVHEYIATVAERKGYFFNSRLFKNNVIEYEWPNFLEYLLQQLTVNEIITSLSKEYGESEEIIKIKVINLLNKLESNHLIVYTKFIK